MILRAWVLKNDVKIKRLSKGLGVHWTFLYMVFRGERKIGRNLAVKIEIFTNGEVSRSEAMWPEEYPHPINMCKIGSKLVETKKEKTNDQ